MKTSTVCTQDGLQFEFAVVESEGETYLEGWQVGSLYSRRMPFDPSKDDREACERKLIERSLYPKSACKPTSVVGEAVQIMTAATPTW